MENTFSFDAYQKQAMTFAAFENPYYPYFALSEEVGEFMGKLAKFLRGDAKYKDNPAKLNSDIVKELGDILWQLTAVCETMDLKVSDIAKANLIKLTSRKERGVIKGDGDNR